MVAVPNVPGVPNVAFDAVVGLATVLLTADGPGVLAIFGTPQWGVYSNGVPVVVADTVLDLSHRVEHTISDYPQEAGAFASYDKVEEPYQARIRFAAGGNSAARDALLTSIDAIVGDLNLYDVVTPDATYQNANLVRREYRREAQDGVSLLMVDVILEEVRLVGDGTTIGGTQAPSGASQVNDGSVQATPATAAQTSGYLASSNG